MRYLRTLAFMAAALLTASMAFSMINRSLASITCFAAAFLPLGIFCHMLDRHERKTNHYDHKDYE